LLLTLNLPHILDYMTAASVEAIHAGVGDELERGAKLLDLKVDLTAGAAHDCPPISYYRILLRERARLTALGVSCGDEPLVGAELARFASLAPETGEGAEGRPARVAIAAIFGPDVWD